MKSSVSLGSLIVAGLLCCTTSPPAAKPPTGTVPLLAHLAGQPAAVRPCDGQSAARPEHGPADHQGRASNRDPRTERRDTRKTNPRTANREFRHEFTQVHMGMPVRIVLHAEATERARAAAAAAFTRIEALEQAMSDYRPDSELRRLERRGGEWVPVSRELFDVLARAVELARATEGSFDPTVGPFVLLWRHARASGQLPSAAQIGSARALVGWRHLRFSDPSESVLVGSRMICLERAGMRLDLGGIAKGYILQEALRVVRAHGSPRALLEAGGDVVAGDPPPGRCGWHITAPGADAAFRARASCLAGAALATSGASVQFVEIGGVRYSHVVDPRTGLGVTSAVTTRVISADAATADALATALTVVDDARAQMLLARFPDAVVSRERGDFR